ncbi:MAG TPA: hypothetical protein VFE47_21540 [Tepidisphaeraceae bacterium]|jgi:hypothetical protein|nr:hypothetical protein [Tepidisphaeraceae bacterium]
MRSLIPGVFAFSLLFHTAVFAQASNSDGPGQGANRIPNSAEQGKVDRPLREKYKAEFASRDAGERGALGKKLREAADGDADPAVKFVYLREARDLAVDAGDFAYAMNVIDDMAASFPIDAREMKATALAGGIDRSRLSPEDLAESYLKFSDEMLAVWDADLAGKSAYLAEKLAARNPPLMAEAKKRDKQAKLERHEILQAIAAQKKLERNADDPEANQALGRHLCFNTNHWEAGLPYLVRSASSALRDLARKESANPADAPAMNDLADEWWEFNDPKAKLPAGAARRRAAFWYAKALPGLSGDRKDVAEKRIAEVEAARSKQGS